MLYTLHAQMKRIFFIETSLNSDVKKFSELSNVDSNFDIVDILSTQNDSAKSDLSDKKDLLDNYSPC